MKNRFTILVMLSICVLVSICFATAPGMLIRANPLNLAQSHADICQANLNNCLQGCAGATSCSNQCQVNYQGCMASGG
jgi:hypothetical protein